jgi:hypothetical protein
MPRKKEKADGSFENRIAYIHGRLDQQIQGYAESLGIPTELLAERLATLLRPSGSWSEDQVSSLRLPTEERPTVGKVEGTGDAHGKATQGGGGRVKSSYQSTGQKKYWDKFTPEEKSTEMARRLKVRMKNKEKKKHAA